MKMYRNKSGRKPAGRELTKVSLDFLSQQTSNYDRDRNNVYFWITVFVIAVIFSSNIVSAETISPPYTDISTYHTDGVWLNVGIGDTHAEHYIVPHMGNIYQLILAKTWLAGIKGIWSHDAVRKQFSVEINGDYAITFNGHTSGDVYIVSSSLVGNAKGGGDTKLEARIIEVDGSTVEKVLYETPRSLGDVFGDVKDTYDILTQILSGQFPGQEIGDELTEALNGISSPVEEWTQQPFSVTTTVHLDAGTTYNWALSLISSVDSISALNACNVTMMNLDVSLESVTIAPLMNSHTIIATSGSNGSIDPEGNIPVLESGNKTFNATPNTGYVVDRWYVDEQDYAGGVSSLMFTNVQSDRKVHVTFKQQEAPGSETETFTASADTMIREYSETSNYGSWDEMGLYGIIGHRSYSLVKFNLNSIPDGSTINSVELKLYSRRHFNPDNVDTWLAILGQSWSESTAKWSNQPSLGSGVSIWKKFTGSGYHTWSSEFYPSLKTLAQDWVNGTKANNGFILVLDQGTQADTAYYTKEWGTSSQRPKMTVTYTPPSPPDLIITDIHPEPTPSGNRFFVDQEVDWYVTVRNNSGGPAGSSRVGYYLGTSSADLTNRINRDTTDALDNSESETDHDNYVFIGSDIGQRYLICKADYDGDVDESNEDNNTRVYGPFKVAPAIVYYTLTSSVIGGNGTISAGGIYNSSEVITLTATPDTGYKVKSWSGMDNDNSTATRNTVTMTSNKTVAVEFELITYTLSTGVSPSGGGSVTKNPNKSSYNQNESVQLTVNANSGYTFSHWSGDASGSSNPQNVTMNSNKSVTANFTATKPTVSIAAVDSDAGELPPGDPLYPNDGVFRVTRTGSTTLQLVVYYNVSGSATLHADYVRSPEPVGDTLVTIPQDASYAEISVRPVDDPNVEGAESIIFTLESDAAYTVGSPSSATVTIYDDDLVGDFCGADYSPPDGYVDVWDLMLFADHWHTSTGDNWDAKFDLTGPDFGDADGYVDVWDLMVFADNWHKGQKP